MEVIKEDINKSRDTLIHPSEDALLSKCCFFNGAEQVDICMGRKNLGTDFTSFTNSNSKWIIDLDVKCTIMKIL